MKNNNFLLTPKEEELMELLWQQERPLSSVEMLELAKNHSWKDNYIHVMLRSLQQKKMIRVCGTIQCKTQYARQFEPTMTREEYLSRLVIEKGRGQISAEKVMVAMAKEIKEKDKQKVIDRLEEIIKELRSE